MDGRVGEETYRALNEARWSLGDRLLRYDPERAIRGDDVINLQERLHELGYDAGPVDGVFGVDTGTPILPPGEAAILAVGAIKLQPWVHKGKVKPRQVTTLALSFDHRVVDGEQGSRFLADVAAILRDPAVALTY